APMLRFLGLWNGSQLRSATNWRMAARKSATVVVESAMTGQARQGRRRQHDPLGRLAPIFTSPARLFSSHPCSDGREATIATDGRVSRTTVKKSLVCRT